MEGLPKQEYTADFRVRAFRHAEAVDMVVG